MVSGTDEHGTPILVEAEKEGLTAQELANRYNRVIAKDLCDLGLSYDLFTRTTTGNHEHVVQELFKQCLQNGYIYKGTQKVAISPSTGRTLPDRYIEGECPICHADGARGDQCDACGNELDPDELINPVSKINGETPRFEGDRTLLPRPAGARRGEPRVAQDPQGLAHQRHQLLHRPVQGSQAPRHHARHRLGHPRTGGGMDRQSEQEVVRVVRRGDRLPVGLHRMGPPPRRPGEVARVVERPELPGLLLHGQGQHHLPLPDLALRDACLQRQGFQGRRDR